MGRDNSLWGAERIRGAPLKVGIRVARRTVPKYLRATRNRPTPGLDWATFLKTHAADIFVCSLLGNVSSSGKVMVFPLLGGLHHDNRLAA